MLLVPLLSPQGWDYVLLLATPAVVCLMDRWPRCHDGWRVVTGAALALMSLTIFDLMGRDALRAVHGTVDRERRGAGGGRGARALAMARTGVRGLASGSRNSRTVEPAKPAEPSGAVLRPP